MGATSYYALPFPDTSSTVDVPRDIQALAQKLEEWSGGFTVPAGHIRAGDPTNVDTTRRLGLVKKTGADVNEWAFGWYNEGWIAQALKNGAQDNARPAFVFGQDGQITTFTYSAGTVARPVPFAVWCGVGSVTLSSAASGAGAAVPIPAGRFTQSPIFSLQVTGGSSYIAYASAASLTSVTPAIRDVDGTARSGTYPIHIMAVQMTPTSATG